MRMLLVLAVTCSHALALLVHGAQPVRVARPHLNTPHVSMAVAEKQSLMDKLANVVIMVGGKKVGVKKEEKFVTAMTPLTEEDVLECQKNWAGAIAAASAIYRDGGDYIQAAAGAANDLYGYGFPRKSGGPMHWARHVRAGGLPKVVADLRSYAAAHPNVPHWEPCALLLEQAEKAAAHESKL